MTNQSHARVSLTESDRSKPPRATLTGPIAPQQLLTVSIIVRRKKPLNLHDLGGRIVSHEEFASEYAGDPADFTALRELAHQQGLAVDESASSLARRTMVVRGPAAAMEKTFGVTLKTYQHLDSGCHFHAFEGTISLADNYASMIEAVLGLDTRPVAKSHVRRLASQAAAAAVSYNPPQVAALYNFPTGVTGAGQTIGILELGGGYEASDITTYFGGLGVKPPSVVAVSVDGGTNSPGDPNGADGEVALDIQVAGSIAPGANIAVYFAPNTDQGFIDAITTAVHDTANKPSILSISWGGPEASWAATSRTALDNACQSAAALGVTITVASGDSGSTDGGTGENVDFPASSPHVLGCGGTHLEGSGTTIKSEVVWDDQATSGGGASGGGVSTIFALPTWQANAGVPNNSTGKTGRGVPDVAGNAAPSTGYNVLIDGQAGVVGGTSAVAPLWAGLLALVNQQRSAAGGGLVGFVNPTLYANPSAFHDITSGNNGSYKAGAGWDACTGLGSPAGTAIATALGGGTVTGSGGGTGTGSGGGTGAGSGGGTGKPPVHKKKHHPKHAAKHEHGQS